MGSDTAVADALRRLTEALPEPHLLVRADGTVVHANGAARRRLGPIGRLEAPEGPPRDALEEALRRWSGSGSMRPAKVVLARDNGVAEEVRVNGARIGEDLLVLRLDDGPGSSSFALLSLQRRSDHIETVRRGLERANAQLEHVNRQLERQNELLSEYAAYVSHDLRAPLAVAAGALELLDEDADGPLGDELFGVASRAVHHAQEAADAVLELIRFVPARPDEAVDLAAVATSVAREFDALAVTVELPEMGVWIPESHLRRLLTNLFDNAGRYRHEERAPTVVVRGQVGGSRAHVEVEDNGRGIPASQQQDVFTLFRRGRDDTSPGSGVGLASCRRVIHAYGGDLTLRSDGHSGSTFLFDLPAR